jgi:hypothetical protein
MAQINPVSGSNNTSVDQSQLSSLNNDQITSMLVGGKIDPKFAVMLLNQMSNNNVNSILFGNETDTSGIDFGVQSLTPNNIPGTTNINDTFGASAFSNVTPQFQLSVYSSLIGKTVTAVNPSSGKTITDKVTSVLVQNGKAMLNVNGAIVPPENLLGIK